MANNLIITNNQDAVFVEVDAIPGGYTNDGIFYKTSGGKHYKIAHDGAIRAVKAGVLFDGTDQTARINTILAHADVHELIFDAYNKSITISGTVTVPAGKKLVFKNHCKLIGAGTIADALIECDFRKQCFANTLTLTGLLNSVVSVMWFGAVADMNQNDQSSGTDQLTAFNKALLAMAERDTWQYAIAKSALYIPCGGQDMGYRISGAITFNGALEVYGDGWETTVLCFYNSTGGFIFPQNGYRTSTRFCYVHDIALTAKDIRNEAQTGWFDDTKHGIYVTSSYNKFERVRVTCFLGHGFKVFGNAPTTNANLNTFIKCWASSNSGDGFYFEGSDSNVNCMYDCDSHGNSGWGFRDKSFLGNTAINCHTAYNGATLFNTSRVSISNVGYYCIKQHTNKEPLVAPDWLQYWVSLGPGYGVGNGYRAWDALTQYEVNGAYNLENPTQKGAWLGCYSEEDQYAGQNLGDNLLIGGFAASPQMKGSVFSSRNNVPFLRKVRVGNELAGYTEIDIDPTGNNPALNFIGNGKEYGFSFDSVNGVMAGVVGGNGSGQWWFTQWANALSYIGRSAFDAYAVMALEKGLWLRPIDEGSFHFRAISTAYTKPIAGKWADGDIVLSAAGQSAIAGWKIITAGDFAGVAPSIKTLLQETDTTTINYAAAITPDASLSTRVRIVLTGNTTIAAPTNPTDGQRLQFVLAQDNVGSRLVTWQQGIAGSFRFSTDAPEPALSTAAFTTDRVIFEYNAADLLWDCLGSNCGFAAVAF